MRITHFALVGILAAAALPAHAGIIYSNNFSTAATGFTGATTLDTTPSGEKYLPLYNGGSTGVTTLTLNTANLKNLSVAFDVYALRSTDGNGEFGGGPDQFQVAVNGVQVVNYNFANFGGDTQNYSGNPATSGPGFHYAARTGAVASGTLGYGTGDFGDATYLLTLALPNAATTTITFSGLTNQGFGDETYGIDNVIVTGDRNTVPTPEPAALALLGLGVAGLAAARRRARNV